MVKGNNVLPNIHCHKHWHGSTTLRGDYVKTWLNQPAKKKARRLARKAKAAKIAPRPLAGPLRPVVHCPTNKYNSKVRFGRGFTLDELKEAGINRQLARTIGIAVDHRRTNASVEALQANVNRLKEYRSKLILFPRKSNQKPKKGDSPAEETKNAVQFTGVILPINRTPAPIELVDMTEEMKNSRAHYALRDARNNAKLVGPRSKPKAETKAETAAE